MGPGKFPKCLRSRRKSASVSYRRRSAKTRQTFLVFHMSAVLKFVLIKKRNRNSREFQFHIFFISLTRLVKNVGVLRAQRTRTIRNAIGLSKTEITCWRNRFANTRNRYFLLRFAAGTWHGSYSGRANRARLETFKLFRSLERALFLSRVLITFRCLVRGSSIFRSKRENKNEINVASTTQQGFGRYGSSGWVGTDY